MSCQHLQFFQRSKNCILFIVSKYLTKHEKPHEMLSYAFYYLNVGLKDYHILFMMEFGIFNKITSLKTERKKS